MKPTTKKTAPAAPTEPAAPTRPACVAEVEAGFADSLAKAWARLAGKTKLSNADIAAWVSACRAERARWVLRERRKDEADGPA